MGYSILMTDVKFVNNNSNNLIISFSGYYKNIYLSRFEWYNILTNNKHDCDLLFLKDINLQWYLKGIKSLSYDVKSTLKILNDICDTYNNICLIGSSMGGYASLLYGYLLSFNHKITIRLFSHQTDIVDKKGNKWTLKLSNKFIPLLNEDDIKYTKLQNIIDKQLDCIVYYGNKHIYDYIHYDLISNYVKCVSYPTDTHAIAKYLKENGLLVDIIKNIFKGKK
jgi:hypothetical protein